MSALLALSLWLAAVAALLTVRSIVAPRHMRRRLAHVERYGLMARPAAAGPTSAAADTFPATIARINDKRLAFFTPAFMVAELLRSAPSLQQADGSKDPARQLTVA